ncbi:MAG: hypothetical protein RJQ14_28055, partial [Marinoscillum sp.]
DVTLQVQNTDPLGEYPVDYCGNNFCLEDNITKSITILRPVSDCFEPTTTMEVDGYLKDFLEYQNCGNTGFPGGHWWYGGQLVLQNSNLNLDDPSVYPGHNNPWCAEVLIEGVGVSLKTGTRLKPKPTEWSHRGNIHLKSISCESYRSSFSQESPFW